MTTIRVLWAIGLVLMVFPFVLGFLINPDLAALSVYSFWPGLILIGIASAISHRQQTLDNIAKGNKWSWIAAGAALVLLTGLIVYQLFFAA